MKKKWWIISAAVLLAVLICIFAFWDAIVIRVAPRLVLSEVVLNTFSGLHTRFEHSPVQILAKGIDPGGQNTIDFTLDTENPFLGALQYRLEVQTGGSPREIYAEGTVASRDSVLDLSLYMNRDYAAVSSDSLLDGYFYGITYETFPEDIRRIPLISLLAGEKTLRSWEDSVANLQKQMEKTYAFPNISPDDLKLAVLGVIALKPDVSRDTMTLDGQEREVYKLSFCTSGQEIVAAAGEYSNLLSDTIQDLLKRLQQDPASKIEADFYLDKDHVVKLLMNLMLEGESLQIELLTGTDIAKDNIYISAIAHNAGELKKWAIEIETQFAASQYIEKLNITAIENGVQDRTVIAYDWNLSSGDLQLHAAEGERESDILLNLRETEGGFRLATNQYEDMMNLLRKEEKRGSSFCIMEVTKGSSISAPEFKNLDQWSMEDFLILLEGFGGLLGLNPQ